MGEHGGILLRVMTTPTLSFLLIRRGGDVEGRRAEQGGRTGHWTQDGTEVGTEAGACAAAAVGRAGRGSQAARTCGGGTTRRRGRTSGARACDRTRATRRAHRFRADRSADRYPQSARPRARAQALARACEALW